MSKLGKVLLLVCLLDLATTLLLINLDIAGEANPILNYYFVRWGVVGLVVGKMWLVLIPIFVLEVARRVYPHSRARIALYYKITIGLYVAIFAGAQLVQFV